MLRIQKGMSFPLIAFFIFFSFRGREIAWLAAALGPLVFLAAAIGPPSLTQPNVNFSPSEINAHYKQPPPSLSLSLLLPNSILLPVLLESCKGPGGRI